MNQIEPSHEFQPVGMGAFFAAIALIVMLIVVVIAGSFWAESLITQPRVVCFIGDEITFDERVDAVTQSDGIITITLDGFTNTITPPEGGKCYVAR